MGTFDGNGCTISGLYCNYVADSGVGLFGIIGTAVKTNSVNIKNVVLANSYLSATSALGGIVGYVSGYGAKISNCVVAEDVMIVKSIDHSVPYTGGIIGQYGGLSGSVLQMYKICCAVSNCVNLGTVQSMIYDFTQYTNNQEYIGSITGAYAEEGNAYEFIAVDNCYFLSGHLKDKNGNTLDKDGDIVNIGKGGGPNRRTSGDCTILSSATASHTCLSVTHKEVQPTCEYTGLSEYSFCLICGKVTSGTKTAFPITHKWEGTCVAPKRCTVCGLKTTELVPDNHESVETYFDPCNETQHYIRRVRCDEILGIESHGNFVDGSCEECFYACRHSEIIDDKCSVCGLIGRPYVDRVWDGENKKVIETFKMTQAVPVMVTSTTTDWTDGWYIASGETEIADRVTVSGTAHLILEDGCSLSTLRGIRVGEGNTLYIYAQSQETETEDGGKTSEQFESGEVAYLLQAGIIGEEIYDEEKDQWITATPDEIWGQKIGTDKYPVFGGDKVYIVTNCKDESLYSNTNENVEHKYNDGICTVCGAEEPINKLAGYTIGLGDKIAVNYYMSLTEKTLSDANAKMVFTVPDSGSAYTVEIPVSEAVKSGNYYVFTCEVAAKEMTSVIEAKLVTSEGELQLEDYTVQQYAEVILSDATKYAKEQELVKAMLNYGAYAQLYFNYNTESLANSILVEADRVLSDADLSNYEFALTDNDEIVSYYGSALSLETETAIKCYFIIDGDAEAVTATVNGKKAELKKNGNLYELKISDISAHQLNRMYEIKVGDLTLTYGVFSYGYTAMSSTKDALKNVVKAMYEYNQMAVAYKG